METKLEEEHHLVGKNMPKAMKTEEFIKKIR